MHEDKKIETMNIYIYTVQYIDNALSSFSIELYN